MLLAISSGYPFFCVNAQARHNNVHNNCGSLGCRNGTWLEMCEGLLLVKLNVILPLKKTKKTRKESTIYPLY